MSQSNNQPEVKGSIYICRQKARPRHLFTDRRATKQSKPTAASCFSQCELEWGVSDIQFLQSPGGSSTRNPTRIRREDGEICLSMGEKLSYGSPTAQAVGGTNSHCQNFPPTHALQGRRLNLQGEDHLRQWGDWRLY